MTVPDWRICCANDMRFRTNKRSDFMDVLLPCPTPQSLHSILMDCLASHEFLVWRMTRANGRVSWLLENMNGPDLLPHLQVRTRRLVLILQELQTEKRTTPLRQRRRLQPMLTCSPWWTASSRAPSFLRWNSLSTLQSRV